MPFYTIQEINPNVTMDTAEKGTIPKQPLERSASSPKISYQPTVTIPTKKLRMRSLLWIKPPSGHAVSTTSSFLAQLFPTLIVNIAAISVGLGYGLNSVIVAQLKSHSESLTSSFTHVMDDGATGWIGGMFGLGAIFGGFGSAIIGSRIGRRRCLLFLTLPDIVGWIILAASFNLYTIYVGRFLCGFASAGYIPSILIYVAEISQPQHRGVLSAITLPSSALGSLLAYCLGSLMPWNLVAVVGVVVPIVLIPGLLMISNSPHWYLNNGEEKMAVQAMEKFRSSDANGLSELLAIADVLKQGREESNRNEGADSGLMEQVKAMLETLAHRKNRRPLILLNILFLVMIFSGDFSISFYSVEIFKKAAFGTSGSSQSSADCFLSAVIVGGIRLLGALLFLPAIKYCTRKVLLATSAAVMCVSMVTLGVVVYLGTGQTDSALQWLPLASMTIYTAAGSLGLGSLPYVYIGELFSAEMRPVLAGMTIGLAQLELFLVIQTFPSLQTAMTDGAVFWGYGAVCLIGVVFTLMFVPETKDKSLEEIEYKFDQKRNLHVTPYSTPMQQRRNRNRPHPLQSIQFTQ